MISMMLNVLALRCPARSAVVGARRGLHRLADHDGRQRRIADARASPYLFATRRAGIEAQSRRNFAKVSALSLTSKKRQGHKISMVTAYDYPSAIHVARAGIDVLLVGDSVAMVELGHETTQPLTMDAIVHHCQSVKRGVAYAVASSSSSSPGSAGAGGKTTIDEPLLVGDMPFGSYEFDDTDRALANAYRFVKEAGMDAVKVEVSVLRCFLLGERLARIVLVSLAQFLFS
jgi:hypothetical protein